MKEEKETRTKEGEEKANIKGDWSGIFVSNWMFHGLMVWFGWFVFVVVFNPRETLQTEVFFITLDIVVTLQIIMVTP